MKVGATVINMDCEPMARESMEYLVENTSDEGFVFLTDNGSMNAPSLEEHPDYPLYKIAINEGVNLVWYKLKDFLIKNEVDILLCGHADFFVVEKDWDKKVKEAFEADDKLVLAGFVGSNEVDSNGGRGAGTHLSFVGNKYRNGPGSPWKAHGRKAEGVMPAACFDHCVMIYKVSEFDRLRSYFSEAPPMHFEDRILPVAANYHGYHCALIGVDCDHISGAKSTGMPNYFDAVKRWLDANNMPHPTDGNYDRTSYIEAEKQFLGKWRDEVHLIPFKVKDDYTLEGPNINTKSPDAIIS
jgi:hypothetical protein